MKRIAVLLTLGPCLAAAQVYRCADGSYQQRPCEGGTQIIVPAEATQNDWGATVARAIGRREVLIGMTSAEVVRSWGRPNNVNRTVRSAGTFEQWVYRRERVSWDQYLYLEDGVLVSAQGLAEDR